MREKFTIGCREYSGIQAFLHIEADAVIYVYWGDEERLIRIILAMPNPRMEVIVLINSAIIVKSRSMFEICNASIAGGVESAEGASSAQCAD